MTNTTRLRVEPLEDRVTPAAAGDLDLTFSGDGTQTTPGTITNVALVPDGRILSLSQTGAVARFEPDGDPDATFGTGGVAPAPGFSHGFGTAVAALADGGAVVGWVVDAPSASEPPYIRLIRLTAAGTLDPTFGTGGTAVVAVRGNGADAYLAGIVVLPGGRVVLAGSQTQSIPTAGPSAAQIVVARLTAAGQPDPTFGTGGTTVVDLPADSVSGSYSSALDVQADGRVVVAGRSPGGPVVVRLTSAGQLDPTFGTGGVARAAYGGSYDTVRVLGDGRVMLGGVVADNSDSGVITYSGAGVRLTPDGRLDPTYDGDGIAITVVLTAERPGSNLGVRIFPALDATGRAVFEFSRSGTPSVYRLTPAGAADTTFGTNGRAEVTTQPAAAGLAQAVLVQSNGDILFGGAGADNTLGRLTRLVGVATPVGFTPATAGTFVAGGPANGAVQVLTPNGSTFTVSAESAYVAGLGQNLRPAVADVTGDGTLDYVLAAGPGGPPRVVVLDGATGRVAADFAPFESGFFGGAFAAAADLDRDGRAEIIVTPDQGGGGRVVVFSVATGGATTLRASFFGIDDPNFRGGARVAAGDVDRDGTPDVVVAAGFGGGPRVAVFGGASVVAGSAGRLTNDFFAFPGADAERLRNGVFVAAADMTGDGFAELIFGGGPGGAPRVFVLSGALVSAGQAAAAQAAPVLNFFSGDANDRGGARVAARDTEGDGRAELAVGSGSGAAAAVRVYAAGELAFNLFGAAQLADGVHVG